MGRFKFHELNSEMKLFGKDGFYQLDKDKEAVKEYQRYIDTRMMKFKDRETRMNWLVQNNYYYPELFKQYTMEQIMELEELVYCIPFEWKSFMAISKFYKSYALKTNNKKKILETYQDRIVIESLYLAQGDFEKAKQYAYEMIIQNYQPATPTFMNGGRARRGEMISCFLTEIDDSLNAITYNWSLCAQLSKIGGGVANNLSKIRARDEEIKGVKGVSSGVIPVMRVHEDIFSYVNQLGQRDGSGADYLNVFHPDIVSFLDTKKINADEKIRMPRLSIGVTIPSIFIDLASRDEDYYVFYPYSVYKEYGKHMDDMDMDKMYYDLLANENVRKEKCELSARELLNKIATTQIESGYPYVFFRSNANKKHPLRRLGDVKFTNLCTEIMQLSTVSVINDYGVQDQIGYDIQCVLGSLNIVNVMESKRIREAVHVGTDMLTSVMDLSNIPNAPGIKKAQEDFHAIGLGAMNLHGFLAKNKIMYESEEAREFADIFFMLVNYYSIEKSMLIAKERGQKFKGFELSDYADGSYFEYQGYLTDDYTPKSEKVAKLFEGIYIPTKDDWYKLAEQVYKHGLYHAYRLAIAPTQSIGYVQNSTASVMPITAKVETRTYGDSQTYYPAPFLSPETQWYYKSAYDMNQKRIIDMVATIQKHVDQGISCILFVNDDIPTEQLVHYYVYAHYKGLKSLYYTRTRNLTADGCENCAV